MDDSPNAGGMIVAAQDALAKAGRAAGVAAAAAAIGLAALVVGMIALAIATVAIVSRIVGEALSVVANTVRDAIPALVAAVPAIAEAAFVGLALLAGVWSGLMFWRAFEVLGPLSLSVVGLAGVLGLAPLLLLYAPNRTAGTAALAMGVSLAGGWVVGRIPLLLLVGVLGGLYLWLVLSIWNRGANPESEGETHGEQDAWDHHDPTVGDVDFVLGGDEHRLYEVDLTRYAG